MAFVVLCTGFLLATLGLLGKQASVLIVGVVLSVPSMLVVFARGVVWLRYKAAILEGPDREHRGHQIWAFYGDEQPAVNELDYSYVCDALDLLREADPRRYARALRYTPRLFIRHHGNSVYLDAHRAAAICLDSWDPAEIAATIVHEATHGYLHARAVPYRGRAMAFHERVCFIEQARFLKALALHQGADSHAAVAAHYQAWASRAEALRHWSLRARLVSAFRACARIRRDPFL